MYFIGDVDSSIGHFLLDQVGHREESLREGVVTLTRSTLLPVLAEVSM